MEFSEAINETERLGTFWQLTGKNSTIQLEMLKQAAL